MAMDGRYAAGAGCARATDAQDLRYPAIAGCEGARFSLYASIYASGCEGAGFTPTHQYLRGPHRKTSLATRPDDATQRVDFAVIRQPQSVKPHRLSDPDRASRNFTHFSY